MTIHIIRTSSGDVMATARGVSKEAAESWRKNGCELFEVEVDISGETVGTVKRIYE